MGLGSWAAFTPAHGGVMVMGDTVVFEDEVNPAMSAALEAGLEVTALHNHFFFDEPKVYFMHLGGIGDASTVAAGVEEGLRQDRRGPRREPDAGEVLRRNYRGLELDRRRSAGSRARVKGQATQGMFKVVIGRPATMHGVNRRQGNGRQHLGLLRRQR